jgi:hypothetical protein
VILAGIDEAGLGPALGPLAVAAAALRVPDGWTPACPWRALAGAVKNGGGRGDGRLFVADSKVVFRGGVDALERGVLAFLACHRPDVSRSLPWTDGRDALLSALHADAEARAALGRLPWYAGRCWAVPAAADAAARDAAAALGAALAEAEAGVVALRARLLPAEALNARFAAGENKGAVLLAQTGAHLRALADAFLDEPLRVMIDKQGGRTFYLPFLMDLFPGEFVRIGREAADGSVYRWERPGAPVTVVFRPRADGEAFAVALASLVAKYLRERCMEDLNAFFAARVPGLRPTAGYHGDAPRFLEAVAGVLAEEGIGRDRLVRRR